MPAVSKVTERNQAFQASLSTSGDLGTPPNVPTAQLSDPLEFARQVLDALKTIHTPESKNTSPVAGPQDVASNHQDNEGTTDENLQSKERATKIEIKKVNERYVDSPVVLRHF